MSFESLSHRKSQQLQWLETNLIPQALQKLEREYTHRVSGSEIIQKICALGADEEEDDSDILPPPQPNSYLSLIHMR